MEEGSRPRQQTLPKNSKADAWIKNDDERCDHLAHPNPQRTIAVATHSSPDGTSGTLADIPMAGTVPFRKTDGVNFIAPFCEGRLAKESFGAFAFRNQAHL